MRASSHSMNMPRLAFLTALAILLPSSVAASLKGCAHAEQQCRAACAASGGPRSFSCQDDAARYQCACQVTS